MTHYIHAHGGAQLPIPDYGSACITALPSLFHDVLIGSNTGPLTRETQAKVRLDGVKNVVFFLVDGFGFKQWEDYKSSIPTLQQFERDGYVGKLDSVFPSCTPNALNTLHANGRTPAQHGLIDWWLYVKSIDKIIATLPFAAMGVEEKDSALNLGVDATVLMDCKSTYEALSEQGVTTRLFTLAKYTGRAHTKVTAKGSAVIPYDDAPSLFSTLTSYLQTSSDTPSYNFVYWGKVDAAGHEYGPDSIEYAQAAESFFSQLGDFLAADELGETLVIVSADHGQISINSEQTIYLDTIPGFSDLLRVGAAGEKILPWGGAREVFLAAKDGCQDYLIELLHATIGHRANIIKSQDALAGGLFGDNTDQHPDLASRIGDIIILPKNNDTVWYHHPGEDPLERKGDHGGLTRDEMEVPFALLRPQQ